MPRVFPRSAHRAGRRGARFHAQGFDFADALHLAASEGTEALYTFDERFIRKGRETVPPVLGVPEGVVGEGTEKQATFPWLLVCLGIFAWKLPLELGYDLSEVIEKIPHFKI